MTVPATAGTTQSRIPKLKVGCQLDIQLLLPTESAPVPWQSVSTPAIKYNDVPASSSPFTLPFIYALLNVAFIHYIAAALSVGIKEHSNTEEMPLLEEQTGTSCPTFDLDASELLIFIEQLELLGTVP